MSRWAVVGASSFSGKAFCECIRNWGEDVIEYSRSTGFDLNQEIRDIRAEFVLEGFDFVVNFAALNMVNESWQHWDAYYQTNIIGVGKLARVCAGLDLKKFVQVSTPEVYGQRFGAPLIESDPFNPSTPYAVSRAAADMDLAALHRVKGLPVCFTRSVNVYGPGQQPYRLIPKTVLKIFRGEKLRLEGGGVSQRDFIHIDDMARAIYEVATRGRPGHTYHVTSGKLRSIRNVVEQICELLNTPFESAVEVCEDRLGKDMAYLLNSSKIERELGYQSKIPFELGLRETVDWFYENRGRYDGMSLEYEHKE